MNKLYNLTLVSILVVSLGLSGCSAPTWVETVWSGDKQEFIANISPVASFSMKGWFLKQWVVMATEQVTVSSQVAWRITQIDWKIGKRVLGGQLLLSLEDVNGSISFWARKAAVGLESARDSYNQTQLSLEKALFDTQIGFQKNQVWSISTKQDIIKQQEKIQKDLKDNDLSNSWSNLSLQLNKLESDLSKAELDYQTKLDADNQTIANFLNSVKLIGTDLSNVFQDSIKAGDDLLGVSTNNRSNNDSFELMLGNKDFTSKQAAEARLSEAMLAYDQFKVIVADINVNTIVWLLASYSKGVDSINSMLASINTLLINTEPGGSFSTQTYASYKAQFDGYKSKASGLWTSITSQLNSINSFFATYKQSQESVAKWIESLKQQIDLSKKGLWDSQFNVRLSSQRQLLWLDASLQNQELTDKSSEYAANYVVKNNQIALDALGNAISNAQIAYEEANYARGKFSVEAPIPGTITDVLVDRGQEVNPGTPLFTIVNTNLRQVELDITAGERELMVPWQAVIINQWWISWKWIVESVSEVADRNFGYKVVIIIVEWDFVIWSSVSVQFQWSLGENIVIPLNAVTIVDNGRGIVRLWKNGQIVSAAVWLGSLAGEYVIVTDGVAIDDLIITSDISNFDPEKMEVRVR